MGSSFFCTLLRPAPLLRLLACLGILQLLLSIHLAALFEMIGPTLRASCFPSFIASGPFVPGFQSPPFSGFASGEPVICNKSDGFCPMPNSVICFFRASDVFFRAASFVGIHFAIVAITLPFAIADIALHLFAFTAFVLLADACLLLDIVD